MTTHRKQTKASCVYETIRKDILNHRFAPGVKLQMETLRQLYGVGYSPLREALSRLVTHGIVQIIEQCGFYVAPLSLEELHDLYNIRIYIESIALELSMKLGDDAWEADVIAAWHSYEKYLNPKTNNKFDPVEWDCLQNKFRLSLVKACRSPWLLKLRDLLSDQASRYRAVCINSHYKNKKLLTGFIVENRKLVNAVLSRNKVKAIKISKESWQTSVKLIAKVLQEKAK